jgi:biopolymer transport protein TolQ
MSLAAPLALTGSSLIGVDLITSITQSDLVGWLCLLLLLGISIYMVALMKGKWRQLNRAAQQNRRFIQVCDRDGPLDVAFAESSRFPDSPLAQLFHEAYMELYLHNWFRDMGALQLDQRLALGKQWVERAVDRTINDQVAKLETRMIHLGTISTISPFIGLFGTVWGVLAAFQSLAGGGAADITALAPGISTALITTIAGLAPAITSVITYNYFQSKMQSLLAEMESYGLELQAVLQNELLQRNTVRAVA